MDQKPPLPDTAEQRLLAAIVFTDVSGYSARMHVEEAAALKLVERDFAAMRELSRELSGTVLKSTGDGLLVYFTSAVQAVSWALRTQRFFTEQARQLPSSEILKHRIGVHVGDIYARADDVMGDGVNIAARVQAEAPPGGICISQTVYDVVKNKMDLHVVRLEPRRLKNIRELIQLYHVLLDEPARPAVTSVPQPSGSAPVLPRPSNPTKPRRLAPKLLVLAALLAGGAVIVKKVLDTEKNLSDSQVIQAALENAVKQTETAPPLATPAPVPPSQPAHDFGRLTTRQPALDKDDDATREAKAAVVALEEWRKKELFRYTKDQPPLQVRPLSGSGRDQTMYVEPNGDLARVLGGATQRRPWNVFTPEEQGSIILSLLSRAASPPPAAIRGAEAFAYLHGLPAMAEALQRQHGSR